MPDTTTLEQRYREVNARLADACARAGSDPSAVILVAVTKHAEMDDIRELLELGHQDLGENRVQQLTQRAAMVGEWYDRVRELHGAGGATGLDPDKQARWHMIGSLQRNKARKAAEFSRLIHTVDSLRLAEELQVIGNKRDEIIDVLVQVNCSEEPQKHGCALAAAGPLAEQIDTMVNVRARGLMTMAAITDNAEDARPTFARCRELFDELRLDGVGEGRFNLLSMGMSNDFEIAIEEGANIVRVGSAIFGDSKVELASEES